MENFDISNNFCSACQKTKKILKLYLIKKINYTIVLLVLLSVISSSHGLPSNLKISGVKSRTKSEETNKITNGSILKKVFAKNDREILQRQKRMMPAMVPIRDRMTSSLCSYEVVVDVNPQRIPNKIDRVLCQRDSCKCVEQGDYRCTQLYAQLNVTYLTNDLKSNFDFEMLNVEYACVCSRGSGSPGVKILEPVLV